MQKIQLRKNMVFIKVLINPISKLKKEADSFCQLPLYPQDRKAKARYEWTALLLDLIVFSFLQILAAVLLWQIQTS